MEPRQLNIFKSKRQRGELLPSPKEQALHIALVKAIRLSLLPSWSFTHFANGGWRTPREAALLKAMGLAAGFPDLVFFGPNKRVYFLELKRAGGRLSEEQKNIRFALMRCGFDYHVTDDFDDAVSQLNANGIIRMRVSA